MWLKMTIDEEVSSKLKSKRVSIVLKPDMEEMIQLKKVDPELTASFQEFVAKRKSMELNEFRRASLAQMQIEDEDEEEEENNNNLENSFERELVPETDQKL